MNTPVIGALEAKTRFAELLNRVARGEQVTITRHGSPVARLVPAGEPDRAPMTQIIARIKASRERRTLRGASFVSLVREGRR